MAKYSDFNWWRLPHNICFNDCYVSRFQFKYSSLNAAQNSWTNFISYRICFRLNELFKSTRAILYMGMDIWPKRYKFTYISRPGLASNFNFNRSFFSNGVKPLKTWRSLFSWVFASLLPGWVFFLKISWFLWIQTIYMNCFLLFPGLFKSSQTCCLQQTGELVLTKFNNQEKSSDDFEKKLLFILGTRLSDPTASSSSHH